MHCQSLDVCLTESNNTEYRLNQDTELQTEMEDDEEDSIFEYNKTIPTKSFMTWFLSVVN